VSQIFDIYIRVSEVGAREGESFGSPDEQEAACRAYADSRGWEVDEAITELDVSGATPVDGRELGRLVRKCEAGESAGILASFGPASCSSPAGELPGLAQSFGHCDQAFIAGDLVVLGAGRGAGGKDVLDDVAGTEPIGDKSADLATDRSVGAGDADDLPRHAATLRCRRRRGQGHAAALGDRGRRSPTRAPNRRTGCERRPYRSPCCTAGRIWCRRRVEGPRRPNCRSNQRTEESCLSRASGGTTTL
jgi:resolvase-like protein